MNIFNFFKENNTDKAMIDNYDKTCHLLSLKWDKYIARCVGYCSLCCRINALTNKRCNNCRAEIEDDTYTYE